jgi:hypothetical protein
MIKQHVVGILIIVVGIVGATALVIRDRNTWPKSSAPITLGTSVDYQTPIATPAWYESHPDALKQDNSRCVAEGKDLPPALCANVNIADKEVSSQDALNALNQADPSGK